MRYLVFITCLWAAPVHAQGTNAPIQDERLNIAECMLTVGDLPASYRTQLYGACLSIPVDLCMVRERPLACLRDTNDLMLNFYHTNRPNLPTEISGKGFAPRAYVRGLGRLGSAFSEPVACPTDRALDIELCRTSAFYSGLRDLFLAALRANQKLEMPK